MYRTIWDKVINLKIWSTRNLSKSIMVFILKSEFWYIVWVLRSSIKYLPIQKHLNFTVFQKYEYNIFNISNIQKICISGRGRRIQDCIQIFLTPFHSKVIPGSLIWFGVIISTIKSTHGMGFGWLLLFLPRTLQDLTIRIDDIYSIRPHDPWSQ